MTVLDASAVLAFLKRERGWEIVEPLLHGARLSSVNLAEVLAKVVDVGRDPELVSRDLLAQGIVFADATPSHAMRVASLQPQARIHDLSYADRFAIALAEETGGDLVTSDAELTRVECGARFVRIR